MGFGQFSPDIQDMEFTMPGGATWRMRVHNGKELWGLDFWKQLSGGQTISGDLVEPRTFAQVATIDNLPFDPNTTVTPTHEGVWFAIERTAGPTPVTVGYVLWRVKLSELRWYCLPAHLHDQKWYPAPPLAIRHLTSSQSPIQTPHCVVSTTA